MGDNLNDKIGFQNEDKAKRLLVQQARIKTKQEHQRSLYERAQSNDNKLLQFEQQKILLKGGRHENYERACHSRLI